MTPAFHYIAQAVVLRVADSLAWGTVIVLFGVLLLRLVRQNASTRFAWTFSTLMAIGALPLISSAWQPRRALGVLNTGSGAITLPDRWAVYLFAAWAVTAGWFVLNLARSLRHLLVVHRESDAINPDTLPSLLRETLEQQRGNRAVALRISDRVNVPTAIGLLKPAILVPRWAMQELSTDELNQIFLHELAHLRRWDDWTNLAQQLVRAIFFFHPAVWWIESRVTLEREMACDDAVLAATASPRAYAECLAHLAEKSFVHRSLALAQAALGRIRQTSLRVAQILDVNRPTANANGWKPAVALVGAFAIACGVWSSRVPRLLAFEDGTVARPATPLLHNSATVGGFSPVAEMASEQVSRPVPVTYARLETGSTLPKPTIGQSTAATRVESPKPCACSLRRVSVKSTAATAVPFTETFFVVIESGDSASPDLNVYQIRMFRLTILRQPVDPAANRTPRREI